MHTHMHSCTLKHRPPALPLDAVFQLFKPQLKLAAQPLEGKAGRIPVITVWLVEWLQLASLSLGDLHTYKKPREARCGYGPVQCNGPLQELRVNKGWWSWTKRMQQIFWKQNKFSKNREEGCQSSDHRLRLCINIRKWATDGYILMRDCNVS